MIRTPARATRHRARPSSPALSPSGIRRTPARATRHRARTALTPARATRHRARTPFPAWTSARATRHRARPPSPALSPSGLHELPTEVLRLYLSNKRLVTTGRRDQLVRRLREYLRANAGAGSNESEGSASKSEGSASEPEGSASSPGGSAGKPEGSASEPEGPASDDEREFGEPDSADERESSELDSADERDSRSLDPPPHFKRGGVTPRRATTTRRGHSRALPQHSHRRGLPRHQPQHHGGSGGRRHGSANFRSLSPSPPPKSHWSHCGSRKRRHSSSSSSSTSSSTRSSGTHSPNRHHQHRCCYRRRHHRRSSSDTDDWAPPSSISCAPPLSRHLVRQIKRGKYVNFQYLLLPLDTPPLAGPIPSRPRSHRSHDRRSVTGLTLWMEAWNRYLCVRLLSHPSLALELAKYQTQMAMLFSHYSAEACIRYDRLFRQATGHDSSQRWDVMREDIYVWCFTRQSSPVVPHQPQDRRTQQSFRDRPPLNRPSHNSFRPSSTSHPGLPPPTSERTTRTATGREICRRFNFGICARGEECPYAHVCWTPGCHGPHPGKDCTKRST